MMNHSRTHIRFKSTQKWINSSPLRARWWDHDCPECDNCELTFKLIGLGATVKSVSCWKCGWEVTAV